MTNLCHRTGWLTTRPLILGNVFGTLAVGSAHYFIIGWRKLHDRILGDLREAALIDVSLYQVPKEDLNATHNNEIEPLDTPNDIPLDFPSHN